VVLKIFDQVEKTLNIISNQNEITQMIYFNLKKGKKIISFFSIARMSQAF